MSLLDHVVMPARIGTRRFILLFVLWKIPMPSANVEECTDSISVIESFDALEEGKRYADQHVHEFLPGMAMLLDRTDAVMYRADLPSLSWLPLKWKQHGKQELHVKDGER